MSSCIFLLLFLLILACGVVFLDSLLSFYWEPLIVLKKLLTGARSTCTRPWIQYREKKSICGNEVTSSGNNLGLLLTGI
jgi:hypothetical protein